MAKKTTESANGSAKASGLTQNQTKVLRELSKAKRPMSRSELSAKTGIQKGWAKLLGAATKGGGGMEDAGLVKSSTPQEGERGLRYIITAKGKQAIAKV